MAGHSKWAQIKRQKGKVDANRGKVFTKAAREITVAVREGGGGDPAANFRLRTAIDRAKQMSVPNENIERAIQKGLGLGEGGEQFESIQYEGYGPEGVAILIESLTDNRNRTAGDIRSYFYKCDGNLGETGCVGWMFEKKGIMTLDDVKDFDELYLIAAEAGAEDIRENDGEIEIITPPDDLESVVNHIQKAGYSVNQSDLSYIPTNNVHISDFNVAKKLLKMLNLIEEHDDVQNVYSNFEIDDAIMSQLEETGV